MFQRSRCVALTAQTLSLAATMAVLLMEKRNDIDVPVQWGCVKSNCEASIPGYSFHRQTYMLICPNACAVLNQGR